MPEEKDADTGRTSLEFFLKLWPIIWPIAVVAITLTFGFGKKDSNTEILLQQNSQLQTKIDGLRDQMNLLSQRVATLEGAYKSNYEDMKQQESYRAQIGK